MVSSEVKQMKWSIRCRVWMVLEDLITLATHLFFKTTGSDYAEWNTKQGHYIVLVKDVNKKWQVYEALRGKKK